MRFLLRSFALFTAFLLSPALAQAEATYLFCSEGRWEGSLVGVIGGDITLEPNGVTFPEFTIEIPSEPSVGSPVAMLFGRSAASPDASLPAIGTIGYVSDPWDTTQFFTVHAWPYDAEETFTINLDTADVILTSVKSGFEYLWRDTFLRRCAFVSAP